VQLPELLSKTGDWDMNRMLIIKTRWFFPLIALALLPNWLLAQGVEVEPNNPCAVAQNFGDTGLPYDVSGNLDLNDVDFFRFNANAGEEIVADLEGSATGQGTLGDPFLGLFDSNCNLLAIDDDNGTSLNSRLYFTVRADGVFVFVAAGCCDSFFFNDTATTEIYTASYTLSRHGALPISGRPAHRRGRRGGEGAADRGGLP
jgi:hypothetical protein